MHDPIAYTYEADTHCPPCTVARFGREPKYRCAICGEPANTVPFSMAGTMHKYGPVASHDFTMAYWPTPDIHEQVDREGNHPGAIAPWDEWCPANGTLDNPCTCVLECGTCRGEIERHTHPEGTHEQRVYGEGMYADADEACAHCGAILDPDMAVEVVRMPAKETA